MQDILPTDNWEVSLTKIEDNFNELNNWKANLSGGNTFSGEQYANRIKAEYIRSADAWAWIIRIWWTWSADDKLYLQFWNAAENGSASELNITGQFWNNIQTLNIETSNLVIDWQNWTSAWTSWTPSWTYITWTTYAKYKIIWKTAHIIAHFSISWVPVFEFTFGGLPFSILGWTTCVWLARVRQYNTLHTASYELTWTWWYVSMHSPQNTFSWLTGTWEIQFSATCEIA